MYGDATGFRAYFLARNKDVTSYTDTEINAALLVASDWIDGVYGSSFVGHKTAGFTQTNQWPRIGAVVSEGNGAFINYYTFPDNVIPQQVIDATYEAAVRQLSVPGCLRVDYTPSRYKRVSVDGAISVDYMHFTNSSEVQMEISIVDTILWSLLDEFSAVSSSGLSGGSSRV